MVPGTDIEINVKASDRDGNPVVLSAKFDREPLQGSLNGPNSPSFETSGPYGVFSWTPGPSGADEEHKVYFTARDLPPSPQRSKSTSEEVEIHVKEIEAENQAPELDGIPEILEVQAGNTLKVKLGAIDPNLGDTLTFKTDRNYPDSSLVQTGFNYANGKWEAQYSLSTSLADKGKSKKLKFIVSDDADDSKQKSRSTTIKIK